MQRKRFLLTRVLRAWIALLPAKAQPADHMSEFTSELTAAEVRMIRRQALRMSADKRAEHLLLAKMAEQAERYDDAVEHMRAIVRNARSLHIFNYESARFVTHAFFSCGNASFGT